MPDSVTILHIECEHRSTQQESERGYHLFKTHITGSQREYYAKKELERLKTQSMWADFEEPTQENEIVIRWGYDSGD